MAHRVSAITVNIALLDDYDAPAQVNPVTFVGDTDGTAIEKVQAFLSTLPAELARASAEHTA